ncbi:MAG TPA: phasin family protein [Thermoanaerobaculia bacterium]|nr:phasin family protein [Thermoanaerobaculia bacterium]
MEHTSTNTDSTTTDKNVQDDLRDSAHRIWLAGLGALAAAGEEGAKAFSRLVDRGRDLESKGKDEVKSTTDKAKEQFDRAKDRAEGTFESWNEKFDEMLTRSLHRLGVPSRDEIQTLTRRVEELTAKIEQIKPRTSTEAEPVIVTPGSPDPTDPAKIIA